MILCLLRSSSTDVAKASMSQLSRHKRRGRFPRFWKIALSAFLSLSLVSCTNENEQFDKQMQQILSWSASAEMILDARIAKNVPEGFTDLAVEKCQTEISDIASQLPQTARTAHARAAVVMLNGLISAAHDEIGHGRLEQGHQHIAELHRYQAEQRSTLGAGG
ncbi:hypothetical protein [Rhizobium leguminosarum]|uniref:hypothetical protein n=1 Tax=Rhizobium leguminosarum TaxID=384 RepID=UPI0012F80F6D|nr:hypothetical protein [Rhizobium leguminosarum]